jgi:hypothetical protein
MLPFLAAFARKVNLQLSLAGNARSSGVTLIETGYELVKNAIDRIA